MSKVVLSLDDDVEVCALLEHVLWPHRVIGVAHAYVALELLAREAFDLFILDVRVPDLDGVELCRRIRREDPNAPIVFCSGSTDEADRLAAFAAGASRYYAKPFEPEAFHAGIERLLYEAEDRNRQAEMVIRGQFAPVASGAAVDEVAPTPELLQAVAWERFAQAGGTRAHFVRVWPAMLAWSGVAETKAETFFPAVGGPAG